MFADSDRGDKCVFECKQGDIKMHSPMDIVPRNAAKNNRYIYTMYVCVSIHIQTGLRSSVFCSISWQLSISNVVLSLRAREREIRLGEYLCRCLAPTP